MTFAIWFEQQWFKGDMKISRENDIAQKKKTLHMMANVFQFIYKIKKTSIFSILMPFFNNNVDDDNKMYRKRKLSFLPSKWHRIGGKIKNEQEQEHKHPSVIYMFSITVLESFVQNNVFIKRNVFA